MPLEIYDRNGRRICGGTYRRVRSMVLLAGLSDWDVKVVQLPVRIPEAAATCNANSRERYALIEFSPRDWLDARTFAHELGHAVIAASQTVIENGGEEKLAEWIGKIILASAGVTGNVIDEDSDCECSDGSS